MPQAHIRTKVHKLTELIKARRAYVMTDKNNPAKSFEVMGGNIETLQSFVDIVSAQPIFAIDDELMTIAASDEFHLSIQDMKKAGVMRLPFPCMTMEFKLGCCHMICMIRDLQHKEILNFEDQTILNSADEFDFYGACLVISPHTDRTKDDYLVVGATNFYVKIESDESSRKTLYITTASNSTTLLPDTPEVRNAIEKSEDTAVMIVSYALSAALLLMATEGVEKEVIETERLNKKRTDSGKTPVPRHTYIRIGRVYRSAHGNASDIYIERKSPRPHWRRGHNRRVHFGKGREQVRWHNFPGRLIAFAGDKEPAAPIYIVSK